MNAPTELTLLPKDDLQAIAPLSIKETVLAQFREVEPKLIALADTYRDVAFDCTTTKGMEAAKQARKDLRDNGRYMLQNAEKRIKAEVNDLKSVMSTEVDRLVSLIKPVEEQVDAQIKAEEDRKAVAAEAERARKAKHEEGIAKIIGYRERAKGQPAAAIQQAIDALSAVVIGDAWEEFKDRAQAEMNVTLASLAGLHEKATADELALAQAEALRVENERMALELAEARAALAAQARTAPPAVPDKVIPQPSSGEVEQHPEEQQPQQVLKAEPQAAEATDPGHAATESPCGGAMGEGQATAVAPAGEQATLKLGTICERLGFTLSSAFISDVLGIHPTATEKNAKLYKASDYDRIRKALVNHINNCIA